MSKSFTTRHQNDETKIQIYDGYVEIRFGKELATEIKLSIDSSYDFFDVISDAREDLQKALLASGFPNNEILKKIKEFDSKAIAIRKELTANRSEKMKVLESKIDKFSRAFTSAMKTVLLEAADEVENTKLETKKLVDKMKEEYVK